MTPEVWVLDIKISTKLKNAFNGNDTEFQLVPPQSHCRNLAEKAIQTHENHLKAGLVTTDPKFPLSEWDRLILQAHVTLNLL